MNFDYLVTKKPSSFETMKAFSILFLLYQYPQFHFQSSDFQLLPPLTLAGQKTYSEKLRW